MPTSDHTGSGAVSGEKPWHRMGATLYTLKPADPPHGRGPAEVNDNWLHVQGPDAEAVAVRIHAALASQPAPVSASIEELDRDALRKLIRKHGGEFFGPRVEHISMEEQAFWRFLDEVIQKARTSVPATPRSDRPLTGTPEAGGDLGELARLNEAATQGNISAMPYADDQGGCYLIIDGMQIAAGLPEDDADFIAAAVTYVRKLLSASSSPAAAGGADREAAPHVSVEGIIALLDHMWAYAATPDDRVAFADARDLLAGYRDEAEEYIASNGGAWSAWSDVAADSDPSDPLCGYATIWRVGWWRTGYPDADCSLEVASERQARALAADLNRLLALTPRPAGPSAQAQSPDLAADGWTEELDLSDDARKLINESPLLLSLLYDLDLLPEQLLSQDEKTSGLIKAYHRLYGVLYAYQALHPFNPAEAPTPESEVRT